MADTEAHLYRDKPAVLPPAERHLARAVGFDLAINDHGRLVLSGHFEYGENGGLGQGLGYGVDAEFLKRFMAAMGVSELRKANGRACWVTSTHGSVEKIEPLFKKDGVAFDIKAWADANRGAAAP